MVKERNDKWVWGGSVDLISSLSLIHDGIVSSLSLFHWSKIGDLIQEKNEIEEVILYSMCLWIHVWV